MRKERRAYDEAEETSAEVQVRSGGAAVLAHSRDVPYQSLVKMLLAEQVEEALHPTKT